MEDFSIHKFHEIINDIHILTESSIKNTILNSYDPLTTLFKIFFIFIIGLFGTIGILWGIWYSVFSIGGLFVNMIENFGYLSLGLFICTILSAYIISFVSKKITPLIRTKSSYIDYNSESYKQQFNYYQSKYSPIIKGFVEEYIHIKNENVKNSDYRNFEKIATSIKDFLINLQNFEKDIISQLNNSSQEKWKNYFKNIYQDVFNEIHTLKNHIENFLQSQKYLLQAQQDNINSIKDAKEYSSIFSLLEKRIVLQIEDLEIFLNTIQ